LLWGRYRWQAVGLFATLAAVLTPVLATDLAAGGDTELPPPLNTAYPTSPTPSRTWSASSACAQRDSRSARDKDRA
jgi:hypothetical protein